MSDDTNVETFPQQQATVRKGKPTITEILDGAASPEEGLMSLADQGDPQAKALREHFWSPAMRLQQVLLKKAVELDPYWKQEGDIYQSREGAAYETPEAFIRAFVQAHRDEILSELPDDFKEAFEAQYPR